MREGHLLGGRVRYDQPDNLYRTGIEPVMLAAAVPARPGTRVLELGTGAGAGLLCLAARVPGVGGVGVELQAELVVLARRNIAANGLETSLSVIEGDLAAAIPALPFDHAFANPPWHAAAGTASPVGGRDLARRAGTGLLATWTRAMAERLRHRGTLTLILPAASLPSGMAALAAGGCGSVSLFPLWPKPEREARIILLQATKGGKGPCRVQRGLVLHRPEGGFTPEAEAILWTGAALELDR
jgi:tRNA1(Val) A37 N6-methylase TrmN6